MSKSKMRSADGAAIQRLTAFPEAQLQSAVVEPLLRCLGFQNVRDNTGPAETGKDLIATKAGDFGRNRLYGIQIKKFRYSGRVGSGRSLGSLLVQLLQARDEEVVDPISNTRRAPDACVFITPYPIAPSIWERFHRESKTVETHGIEIVDGIALLDLLKTHLPETYHRFAGKEAGLTDVARMLGSIRESVLAFGTETELQLDKIFVDAFLDNTDRRLRAFMEGTVAYLPRKFVAVRPRDALCLKEIAAWCEVPLELDYGASPKNEKEKKTCSALQNDASNIGAKVALLSIDNITTQLQSRLRTALTRFHEAVGSLDRDRWNTSALNYLDAVNRFNALHTNEAVWENWLNLVSAGPSKSWSAPILHISASTLAGLGCPLYIRGAPGAGKTTLLRRFGQQLCLPSSTTAPIFVALARLNGASRETLLDACIAQSGMAEGLRRSKKTSRTKFLAAAKRGDYVLLLDGLDEFSPNPDQLLSTIHGVFLSSPGIRVILSCRDTYTTEPLPGALQFTLKPFSDAQIAAFVGKWFGAQPTLRQQLMDWLSKTPEMKETARTPLVLALLCSMVQADVALPSTLLELYQGRFELLIEKWDRAKSVRRLNRAEVRLRWQFLEELALSNHRRKDQEMPFRFALDVAKRYSSGCSDTNGEEVVCDCIRRGLLQHNDDGGLSFGHLTYQEYLAAKKLAAESDMQFLVNNGFDPWWHKTMEFYSAMKMDISAYIRSVLAIGPTRSNALKAEHFAKLAPLTDRLLLEELEAASFCGEDDDGPSMDYLHEQESKGVTH